MKADGQGKLRLKLDLPLPRSWPRRASAARTSPPTTRPCCRAPPVEAAAGRVAFTESSFTLHDVRGRAFGGPIALSGGTRTGRLIEVIARGDASVDATRALFDHPCANTSPGASATSSRCAQDGLARITFESPLPVGEARRRRRLPSGGDSMPLRVELNRARRARSRLGLARQSCARRGSAPPAGRTRWRSSVPRYG